MSKTFKVLGIIAIPLLCIALVGCGPLTLEVFSPTDGAVLTESPVEVVGRISNPSVDVKVNDTLVRVAINGTFFTDVELTEGENVITITASRGGEEVTTKTVTVIYTPVE